MNFSNIKYFLAIAEEGSVSAAARKLYISQQSLSEHLKKLEAEVGAPLFNRGKTLTLTVAGECFYEGGKELVNVYNGMMANIEDVTQKRWSKITIGIPTCYTPPYLPDFLVGFQQRHPEYEICVVKRQHADIAHNMNGADLYLSYLPLSPDLENYTLLNPDPYCVTFQRSLAEKVFGSRWEAVEEQLIQTQNLSLLKEMPFILLRDRYGQLMQDLRDIFQEYAFSPIAGFDSESYAINDEVCISGNGCLITAESYVKRQLYGNHGPQQTHELLSYPIAVTSFETKMAISYEKGKRLHPAEICFIKESAAFFENQ